MSDALFGLFEIVAKVTQPSIEFDIGHLFKVLESTAPAIHNFKELVLGAPLVEPQYPAAFTLHCLSVILDFSLYILASFDKFFNLLAALLMHCKLIDLKETSAENQDLFDLGLHVGDLPHSDLVLTAQDSAIPILQVLPHHELRLDKLHYSLAFVVEIDH